MKRIFDYLQLSLLVAALALMTACGGDGGTDEPEKPQTPTELIVSPSTFTFGAEGGQQDVTIEAPASWSVSAGAWCNLNPKQGSKGKTVAKLVVPANTGKERSAELVVTAAGGYSKSITVTQAANAASSDYLVAQPDQWDGKTRGEMIYEVLVYAFADSNGDGMGDFNGVTQKMDYIASLGAGAIWLSPIHPADSYHGYDVTDYTAVNPKFGTMTDFENLIKAAHAKNIKVYLDYVVNHTGKGHPWYTDALANGEKSATWNYYNLSYNPAADVAAGKFPMVSTYTADDWKTPDGMSDPVTTTHRYKFTIKTVNGKPSTVKVENTEEAAQADNTDTKVNMFLWYGAEGAAHRMYDKGNGIYELVCDFNSPWGFLVRTSNTTWDGGTKWGGNGTPITLGKEYPLNNSTAADLQFEDMLSLKIFAPIFGVWMPELNYGVIGNLRENKPYQHIIASAKGWLDKGVDGFRLDAAKHVYGIWSIDSRDYTFWSNFHEDLNAYYKTTPQYNGKDLYLVAEIFDGTSVVSGFARNTPLSCFNFDFWWNIREDVKSGVGRNVAAKLKGFQQQLTAAKSTYIDAVKLTNHDENRAGEDLEGNINRMRMAGALLLTVSGRPVVYYGEELGYTGSKEANDLYIRQPMRWSTTEYPKYTGALLPSFEKLNTVADLEKNANSILSTYRVLGQLRNIYPAMTELGTMTPCYATTAYPAALSAFYREYQDQKLLVMHNVAGQPIEVTINDTVDKAVAVVGGDIALVDKTVKMPGFSTVVFLLK
ncbi:MAG: alpha-amylase [Rikenellaceae bacterium]|nr:alpha-amylase [Rikenellaceae bacterium]